MFDRVFITGVSPVVMSDITSGYNIAKKGVYLSKLQQESQRDNIILNIRILYYQIQLMKSLINATSQSYASAESNYELVKKQKAVGKVSKFEVLQAQVQYRSLKPKLISLKNQKDILLTNFLTLLNDEDLDSIVISEELQKESNPYKNKSLEYIKSIALKKRTELKLLNGQKYIQRNKRLNFLFKRFTKSFHTKSNSIPITGGNN